MPRIWTLPLLLLAASPAFAQTDLGPFLSGTLELAEPKDNLTLKGIIIDLGEPGDAAGMFCFDTELLRASGGALDRYPRLTSTAWGGGHDGHSRFLSPLLFGTRVGPGWSHGGSFDDPREIPHGPIPRTHGRYRGLYRHGRRVVLDYEIRGVRVLESPTRETHADTAALVRHFRIAPHDGKIECVLADSDSAIFEVDDQGRTARRAPRQESRGDIYVVTDRSPADWKGIVMGAPSSSDWADRSRTNGASARFVKGLAPPHASAGADGENLPRLLDGMRARNHDDTERCAWLDGPHARVLVDLGQTIDVARVDTFSWHRDVRAPQRFTLWADMRDDGAHRETATAKDLANAGWTRLASIDTTQFGNGGSQASSVVSRKGSLGRVRRLLWQLECPSSGGNYGTFISEIDVHAVGEPRTRLREPKRHWSVGIAGGSKSARLIARDGRLRLEVAPSSKSVDVQVVFTETKKLSVAELDPWPAPANLETMLRGGPALWPKTVELQGSLGADKNAYTVDTIPIPEKNPYGASSRLGGLDFFSDPTRAAVCTWKGDVWIVSGIDRDLEKVTWRRYATGLFDALGLKIVDDVVYVHGRDQLTRLHDLNGDGEADRYECFNNDVTITKNFHEFAYDLHTDREGRFYFAKGGPVRPGGHGFHKIVPHHGCVMRVSPDGSKLEVYATGLRAPNGIGVGPSGQVTTGDNEGTWVPRCRLSWCHPGSFEGVVDLSHQDPKPKSFNLPLCWFPKSIDNSSGGQVWVTSDRWGPHRGELLHLSYGQTQLYRVLRETVDGQVQGGVVRFPTNFASGVMRGRFNEGDGQLYLVGLRGWQSRAARPTCFQRVRFTGQPVRMPTGLRAKKGRIEIDFTCELDPRTAERAGRFSISMWNYLWREAYGSPEFSVIHGEGRKGHDTVKVHRARLSKDRRTVLLEIPDLRPCMQMKIGMNLRSADGKPVRHEIYNTIHKLGD